MLTSSAAVPSPPIPTMAFSRPAACHWFAPLGDMVQVGGDPGTNPLWLAAGRPAGRIESSTTFRPAWGLDGNQDLIGGGRNRGGRPAGSPVRYYPVNCRGVRDKSSLFSCLRLGQDLPAGRTLPAGADLPPPGRTRHVLRERYVGSRTCRQQRSPTSDSAVACCRTHDKLNAVTVSRLDRSWYLSCRGTWRA